MAAVRPPRRYRSVGHEQKESARPDLLGELFYSLENLLGGLAAFVQDLLEVVEDDQIVCAERGLQRTLEVRGRGQSQRKVQQPGIRGLLGQLIMHERIEIRDPAKRKRDTE